MKKWLLILLFLIPSFSYAQDCTKGQNVTFAQLPANPAQFTSCHQTDATSCTQGSPPGSGGSTVCFVLWSGSAWVAGFQTPWSGSGGSVTGTNISVGAAGLPDPAISIATSSTGNSCTDFKGGVADSLCDTPSSGVEIATGNTARFFVLGAGQGPIGGSTFQSSGGSVPTCSGGSGTCTVQVGGTNNRGQMVLSGGTAVTALTLTWSASGTWFQAPFCTFTGTGVTTPGACGTSTCIVNIASTSAATVNYLCM